MAGPWQVRVQLEGMAAAVARLNQLDDRLRQRALKKAIAAGARVILAAVKRYVPVQSGLLRKSLGTAVRVYQGGRRVVVFIGPRTGFRQAVVLVRVSGKGALAKSKRGQRLLAAGGKEVIRNPTRYAHNVEDREPFLRPGFDSVKDEAVAVMRGVIESELAKGQVA